jgi:hypothetical protein
MRAPRLAAVAVALCLAAGSAYAQAPPPAADMANMPGMAPADTGMPGMDMSHPMTGVFGEYAMNRESSGTSWQPDASQHGGIDLMRGRWMLMIHALLNGVYDSQSGPRGADQSFVSGMVMIAARRDLPNLDTVNLRLMLSPDALMGKSGYPLLLQTGETADGKTPLVDRQHPHDLLMEMSAAFTHRLSEQDSLFVYGGLPGEPALGPPAFMHRLSGMDMPEVPISHHWLDSTHIDFGVLTAGWVHGNWKLEASAFKGREPDQNRFNIEPPRLDSVSARASWNPTPNLALQASWGQLHSPEQLDPTVNDTRWTGSAIYTVPFGAKGWWSTTVAFGRKIPSRGQALDGWLLESAVKPDIAWILFARAEQVQTSELLANGPVQSVAKLSLGVIHDWLAAKHAKIGLGGLYDFDFVPAALAAAYGSSPHGAMAFVRLKLD